MSANKQFHTTWGMFLDSILSKKEIFTSNNLLLIILKQTNKNN